MASPIPFTTFDLGDPAGIERVLRRFEQSIQSIKPSAQTTDINSLNSLISQIIPTIQQQLSPYIETLVSLQINPFLFNYVTLTTSTTLGNGNAYPNVNVCTTAGNTHTLPAAGAAPGQGFYFVQGDANSTIISGAINGGASYTLTGQYKYVMVTSLGGLYYVVINN